MPTGIYKKFQNRTLEQRFWSYVNISDLFECWNWTGCKQKKNYGQFSLNNRPILSHRLAYILAYGKLQDTMQVLHSCDNP